MIQHEHQTLDDLVDAVLAESPMTVQLARVIPGKYACALHYTEYLDADPSRRLRDAPDRTAQVCVVIRSMPTLCMRCLGRLGARIDDVLAADRPVLCYSCRRLCPVSPDRRRRTRRGPVCPVYICADCLASAAAFRRCRLYFSSLLRNT